MPTKALRLAAYYLDKPSAPFPVTRAMARQCGHIATDALALLGQLIAELQSAARWLIKGKLHLPQLVRQMSLISWDALWMALILVVFSAMVITVQMAGEMVKQGGEAYVGALISMAMVRELGPVMTAVALISVVGTTYAAELTTMNNTEQTPALQMMHVSPSRFLILPRLLAGMLATPMVTIVATTASILAAMGVCALTTDITPASFWNSVNQFTEGADVIKLLIKGASFGLLVALVSTTIGRHSKGGARDVGLATTRAVVVGFVLTALLDYLLTFVMYGPTG